MLASGTYPAASRACRCRCRCSAATLDAPASQHTYGLIARCVCARQRTFRSLLAPSLGASSSWAAKKPAAPMPSVTLRSTISMTTAYHSVSLCGFDWSRIVSTPSCTTSWLAGCAPLTNARHIPRPNKTPTQGKQAVLDVDTQAISDGGAVPARAHHHSASVRQQQHRQHRHTMATNTTTPSSPATATSGMSSSSSEIQISSGRSSSTHHVMLRYLGALVLRVALAALLAVASCYFITLARVPVVVGPVRTRPAISNRIYEQPQLTVNPTRTRAHTTHSGRHRRSFPVCGSATTATLPTSHSCAVTTSRTSYRPPLAYIHSIQPYVRWSSM